MTSGQDLHLASGAPRRAVLPSAPTASASEPRTASTGDGAGQEADDVAVLVLAELPLRHWLWGWSRIVLRDQPVRKLQGLRFAKALGSGYEGGFGLRPSGSRQGLFVVFHDEACADAFMTQSHVLAGYARRTSELLVVKLRATSCRGSWARTSIAVTALGQPDMPVASLTRASIRATQAFNFWRQSPATEASLAQASGCQLAVGLGEAPLLRQATFSLWDNQAAMDAYARSGAHLEAIRGAQQGGWFKESMFARFVPIQLRGSWKGRTYA